MADIYETSKNLQVEEFVIPQLPELGTLEIK